MSRGGRSGAGPRSAGVVSATRTPRVQATADAFKLRTGYDDAPVQLRPADLAARAGAGRPDRPDPRSASQPRAPTVCRSPTTCRPGRSPRGR
jgi:hypothetical protein